MRGGGGGEEENTQQQQQQQQLRPWCFISVTELQFMFAKIHLKHDVFQQC